MAWALLAWLVVAFAAFFKLWRLKASWRHSSSVDLHTIEVYRQQLEDNWHTDDCES
tara:strand:- start:291 stop:458 length:168 start_codon:yes stop_codon:yes gene_type:complete